MNALDTILNATPDTDATFSCAEVSRIIGRHANTLRKYETWGFISPVPRASNGYRKYSRVHALQALLTVTAFRTCFQEWEGRRRMKRLIALAVAGDFASARTLITEHRANLDEWLARATGAKGILARWKERGAEYLVGADATDGLPNAGSAGASQSDPVMRSTAASLIGVAPDTLRDWERNGLVTPRRLPNGRRLYSKADIEKLLVIRSLRNAGYSLMGLVNLFRGKTAIEDLTFARDRWDETLRGLIADGALMEAVLDELDRARKASSGQGRRGSRARR